MISEDTDRWAKFERKHAVTQSAVSGAGPALGSLVLKLLIAIFVIGGATLAFRAGVDREDPRFKSAVAMVKNYEIVRPPDSRDYGHRVYQNALTELDQVDPHSKSAEPAAAMARDLRERIEKFDQQRRATINAQEHLERQRKKKSTAVIAEREYRRRTPITTFPECDH